MLNEQESFRDRVERIQNARQRNRGGMGFIVHPDGVVTPIGKRSSRLRFGFPLKGLIVGLIVAVSVKAYLMWVLGTDVYTLEVQRLLTGTAFEQVAALVLMPDSLSAWVVERYQDIFVFIQGGLDASAAA